MTWGLIDTVQGWLAGLRRWLSAPAEEALPDAAKPAAETQAARVTALSGAGLLP